MISIIFITFPYRCGSFTMHGNSFMFFCHFHVGKLSDFLSASLGEKALTKWGLILKERICSLWSKFFPSREAANKMGNKNFWEGLTTPECVPIPLKTGQHHISVLLWRNKTPASNTTSPELHLTTSPPSIASSFLSKNII